MIGSAAQRRLPYGPSFHPMLSQAEELDLIRRAQRGDRSARDRLWVLFHDYAVAEARRLALRKGTDLDEAESAAALAIPEAIDRFDLRCKVRFSTYLAQRLRGSVTEVVRRERRQTVFDTARYQPGPPVAEYRPPKPPPAALKARDGRRVSPIPVRPVTPSVHPCKRQPLTIPSGY